MTTEPTAGDYPVTHDGPVREMRAGDVVHAHGMLCLVVNAPTHSPNHASMGERHGGCWWTVARVLNPVTGTAPHTAVPRAWIAERGDTWNLQGNDLAGFRWHRPA